MIYRLQSHGFNFTDEPYDVLVERYPNCVSALKWWCNQYEPKSMLNIRTNKGLKEFMVKNPPTFKISPKCCDFAKKNVAHQFYKDFDTDIVVVGVRKAERGARSMAYNSCFSDGKKGGPAQYRPLFWWSDADKDEYCKFYDVKHSKCYTEYGLVRTGCCGCPFGQNMEDELKVIEKHEPQLFKVVNTIFKDSYAYTRAYRKFKDELKTERKK